MKLAGNVALVTGASAGIGKASALALAREGADVAINYLTMPEGADEVAGQIRALGRKALLCRVDVSDQAAVEDMVGRVVRFEAAPGDLLDTYLHVQNGRGVNGVLVELAGGSAELAHDVAVHIAFGQPATLRRDEVPAAEVEAEREALTNQTRNEGKPEAALPKIVEGKLGGWFKRVPGGVLLEQPYARDEKVTVQQLLGDASIVRFAQVLVGG